MPRGLTTRSSAPGRPVSFGAFEFDPQSRELRKRGMRVKVHGQPLDVLAMLLERPGEVVTREELQKRLWPADTYVDFEHSLNAAIKRLRAALGDSAHAARFVETLARQGYRFIAPVSRPGEDVPEVAARNPQPAQPRRFGLAAIMITLGVLLAAVFVIRANSHGLQNRIRTTNPDAYLAYSKGRYYWNKRTPRDLEKAIGFFQQAVEKDPDYALAYDGLADSWLPLGWYGYLSPSATFPNAKVAITRALLLDDSLAEAHTSLAFVKLYYDRDWAGAELEFRRSLDLNPSYANGHHWYAEFLSLAGRHQEAIAQSQRAREIEPLSTIINAWVSSRYFFARQYEKAIEEGRNAVEMNPGFAPSRLVLGQAYEQKGMMQEAIAQLQEASRLSDGVSLYAGSLAHALGIAGKRAEALEVIEELRKMSESRFVSAYDLALAYWGLGNEAKTFDLLNAAIQEGSPRAAFLGVDPRFDGLRRDPRFKDLMRSLGL